MILAIDTSTDQAGVAFVDRGTIVGETSWQVGREHSRHLTRVLRQMDDLIGKPLAALSGVTVAIGPGSFSGIRVGVSAAKGLALARQVPLVGISTLDAIAFQASDVGEKVFACIPAGRNDLYAALYAGRSESWSRTSSYMILSLADACDRMFEADAVAGPGLSAVAAELRARGWTGRCASGPWSMRRPGFLAELGRRYLEADGHDQIDDLEPLYLRRSAAEEKRATGLRK